MRQIELNAVARRVVRDYLGVREAERFVIVTDTRTGPLLAPTLAGHALALGADPVIVMMTPRSRSGEEPPDAVAAAMVEADVVLAAASRSFYHTEAKGAAQATGTRGLFNAPSDDDAWIDGAMTADFVQIREVAVRLADALRARLRGARDLAGRAPTSRCRSRAASRAAGSRASAASRARCRPSRR